MVVSGSKLLSSANRIGSAGAFAEVALCRIVYQLIVIVTSKQAVNAGLAVENIIAEASEESVISVVAIQCIVAERSGQIVVAMTADQCIVALRAIDVVNTETAIGQIVADTRIDTIVADAAPAASRCPTGRGFGRWPGPPSMKSLPVPPSR